VSFSQIIFADRSIHGPPSAAGCGPSPALEETSGALRSKATDPSAGVASSRGLKWMAAGSGAASGVRLRVESGPAECACGILSRCSRRPLFDGK
jgi:hypothetical protein